MSIDPAGIDYAHGFLAAYSDKMRRWMVEDTCTSALILGSKSTKSESVPEIFSVALKVNTLNIRDVLFFVPGNVMVFDLLPFLAFRSLMSLMLNVNGNGASWLMSTSLPLMNNSPAISSVVIYMCKFFQL